MANSKKRCRNCKKYKPSDDMLHLNGGNYCDIECATSYGFKNKEKGKKIKYNQEKKSFRLSDKKIRKEAAIRACHSYIRERDKNKGCITCDKNLIGTKFDAGHFLKSTNSYTKFMEKNIHGQCVYCNQYRGGEEVRYREKIKETYGVRTLNALERCKSRNVKRTAEDYKKIEHYYKQKLKDLVQ